MWGSPEALEPGAGAFSARNLLAALALGLGLGLALIPATPAQAAWVGFLGGTLLGGWTLARNVGKGLIVERTHRPRAFEGDAVHVGLSLRQSSGPARHLLLIEDQFLASLSPRQRHLVPMLSPAWEARLRYRKEAERHRGVYVLGPVRFWGADPMGIFFRTGELDCFTSLTVYPHAVPLEGYRLTGERPPAGAGLERRDRIGQGEEILSVRPYRPGDPLSRVHWRTSARRGALHTMELNANVQAEVALFLDLTKRARFGTGSESTTEVALGCASSVLSQAVEGRLRISVAYLRDRLEGFPPGEGLAHLHLLLDRLATVNFGGAADFWTAVADPCARLRAGSRAVFVVPAATTEPRRAGRVLERLRAAGVATDVILLDESRLIRIWRDQDPATADADARFATLQAALERAGARVLPLARGQTARDLLPRAAVAPGPLRAAAASSTCAGMRRSLA